MRVDIEPGISALIVILVVFFLLLITGSLVLKLSEFVRDLRDINMEISRSGPRERKKWLRRRRRLWLSLLPFVRR